jgi:diacylglycerol kinase family enzyme
MAAGISVIINEHSGAGDGQDRGVEIQSLFAAEGVQVRLERVRHGGDIAARARQAAARGGVLVAAGGDGTVGAVAGVAVETGLTFGVIPAGTLNHFARDLGIPLDLKEAVQAISKGHVRNVDVGDLNGRIFVNNSSLGLYPRMVWEREVEQRRGRSKWTAFGIAMVHTWRVYHTVAARLVIDGASRALRTPFIFVGNNEYQVEGFNLGSRAALDRGRLSVFVAPECVQLEILALPLRALANRLDADPHFERFVAEEITIELSRPRVDVALDGEVAIVTTPLHYRVRPGALRTIVPAPKPGAQDASCA